MTPTEMNAEVIELQQLLLRAPPDIDHMRPLDSYEAVIAYSATTARKRGWDEAGSCEIIVRGAGLSPDQVRHCARILHKLGYIEVAAMLKRIAGRRKNALVPLP